MTAAAESAPLGADAIRDGGCAVWALSHEAECAPQARRLAGATAIDLGLKDGPVEVVNLVASELATNALKHGGKHVVFRHGRPVAGLPELWIYLRGPEEYRELVLTVYDTGAGWSYNGPTRKTGETGELREDGRGLEILTTLAAETGGRWGRHPTRSRLGEQRLPGTAAWFALPNADLPAGSSVNVRPGGAVGQLAELLRARGLHRLAGRASGDRAVLSVTSGLTVWVRDGAYCWDGAYGPRQYPITDVVDVAEQVLADAERARRRREEG